MKLRSARNNEEEKGHVEAKKDEPSTLMYLSLGEPTSTFNLEKAVCNHGFFMMAPNLWIPSTKTLERPLRLADSKTSVIVRISHPRKHNCLHVLVLHTNSLSPHDKQVLLAQVARMLRISEEDERKTREFHEIHSRAKKKGFGRIFRSPSLFEDLAKSILLCHCSWKRTLYMTKALCELQLTLKGGSVECSTSNQRHLDPKVEDSISRMTGRRGLKRKNVTNEAIDINNYQQLVSYPNLLEGGRQYGDFPSSKELANLDEELLRKHCNLGYRAIFILELARGIESGKIKLGKDNEDNTDKLYKKLKSLNGFGSFASDTVLMCFGLYERIPIDTETVRHLKEFHGRKDCTIKTAEEHTNKIYGKYAPFQCLAYWLELLEFYEKKLGEKLSQLPHSRYPDVTGTNDISGRKKIYI